MIDKKWNYIYLERNKKKAIVDRYFRGEINTESSYVYKKFFQLVNRRVLIPVWALPKKYVDFCGYANIFELHKKLEEIIVDYHVDRRNKKIYTQEECEYIERLSKRI